MNHIAIIAALLFLVFNGNVFAESPITNEAAQVPPENIVVKEPPPPVVPKDGSKSVPISPPANLPSNITPAPVVAAPHQEVGKGLPIPANLPPNVTLEQAKAFLSKQGSENFVILNFDDAELADVINTVSSITGTNFIVSPGLNAKITINSSKKIPVSEVLNVFESILEVNGISLVKSGDFFKIVTSASAKQKPLEILKDVNAKSVTYGDRPVTQIIPVKYVPAREVSAVLQPMLSQAGSIIPNPRNNLIIINDNASSIRRLLEVLAEIDIDVFQNKRLVFVQPQYSNAKTLSDDLTNILNALNYTKEEVVLVPIERINSLIVFSSSPDILRTVEIWIKKLDEDVMTGQNIFVYQVQNVKAQTIAEVLHSIYGGESGLSSPQRQANEPAKQMAPAPAKTAAPAVVQKPVAGSTSSGSGANKVQISIFEPTNALVILAPPGTYRDIVNTIKQLDIYPKEVLIEVLVAEVNLTDDLKFGVQWSVLNNLSIKGDNSFTGLTQNLLTDMPGFKLPTAILGSTNPSIPLGAGLSYLLSQPDKISAMIHALAGNGRANILSSPRLLVRDKEEASIEVGSDVPTATSSSQTADTTTANLNQTIQYKTIGIKLKIKPSINDEKTVVLDVEQEVSDKLAPVQVGQSGFLYPQFSTRKTKTSIVVPDQQGIVIGGIIKENRDKNYSGIPVLSRIPLLGYLFRYTSQDVSKTELVIILTPHVITNKSETEMVKTDFLDKLKEVKDALKHSKDIYDIVPSEKPKPEPNQVNEQ